MWSLFVLASSMMPVLSGTLPTEMPSGPAIAGWHRYSGSAVGPGGHRISYELLVDPRRMALYAITRYRIHDIRKADPEDEVIVWFPRPREIRCFERVRRPEGDGPAWEWRIVPRGTETFDKAMVYARAVYQLNRAREIEEENAEPARGD